MLRARDRVLSRIPDQSILFRRANACVDESAGEAGGEMSLFTGAACHVDATLPSTSNRAKQTRCVRGKTLLWPVERRAKSATPAAQRPSAVYPQRKQLDRYLGRCRGPPVGRAKRFLKRSELFPLALPPGFSSFLSSSGVCGYIRAGWPRFRPVSSVKRVPSCAQCHLFSRESFVFI